MLLAMARRSQPRDQLFGQQPSGQKYEPEARPAKAVMAPSSEGACAVFGAFSASGTSTSCGPAATQAVEKERARKAEESANGNLECINEKEEKKKERCAPGEPHARGPKEK
ncbi:hypothetical protein [Variovorax sp. E3]|uniref:hypothetical protein n=1 Tax=Variovorax sp. E3 TaxID=1914993 RepID=UPI0018DE2A73|nr:hypothetical protein [Variovorax sp. E3]